MHTHARCEWFRKALSCGMKESINRYVINFYKL